MTAATAILWRSAALGSAERCVIADQPGHEAIHGRAVLALHDVPASIDYVVHTAPDWTALLAVVEIAAGDASQKIQLERSDRAWTVNGTSRPDLAACTFVDLGWSPATNTLPLRARSLQVNESHTARAAWLRFPELDVVASEQTYTRLANDVVRYNSSTFTAELAVTGDQIVTRYGDDLWRADKLRTTR